MAKSRKSAPFKFQKLNAKEAAERLGVRGKRRSKYSVVGEQFAALAKNEAIVFDASKNEVQGVRNYMRRNFETDHKLRSRQIDNGQFEIQITKV